MNGTMKVVMKEKAQPGAILTTKQIPSFGSKEILIKVKATSICGTDYHIYSWDAWSQNRIKPPRVMGHEFSGEVVAVGSECHRVRVGDMVSAETHIVCERCLQCRTGNAHICHDCSILGVDVDGTFAEYAVIPETNAWVNDKDLDPAIGSMQEPLGNAVHTVLSGPIAGKSVAVVGCGPIGLLAVAVAKACGASSVFAVDINEYRLDLAQKLGAKTALNSKEVDVVKEIMRLTDNHGIDVSCEMSGNAAALNQQVDFLANGGRLSLLGIPTRAVEMDINKIVFKGLTIQGITGRRMYDTWYTVKGLLASGTLDVEPIITHRLPLEEYEKGMELMKSGNCGKVVLIP